MAPLGCHFPCSKGYVGGGCCLYSASLSAFLFALPRQQSNRGREHGTLHIPNGQAISKTRSAPVTVTHMNPVFLQGIAEVPTCSSCAPLACKLHEAVTANLHWHKLSSCLLEHLHRSSVGMKWPPTLLVNFSCKCCSELEAVP